MSSVQGLTLQTGHPGWRVWRPTLHDPYGGGMTNDGKYPQLSEIVGLQLKRFRAAKGLRQEDIAEAARYFGAEWGRSSVAALEGGNRDLRFEELILLSSVVYKLGGWEEPLIPPDATFRLTDTAVSIPGEAFKALVRMTQPSKFVRARPIDEEDEVIRLGAIEVAPKEAEFARMQKVARSVVVFDRILHELWPEKASQRMRARSGLSELVMRMAERIKWPDTMEPIQPQLVEVLSIAAWGRSPADERDARTADRGSYETKRALQSARGHVTRELIEELQFMMGVHYVRIREVFDHLESVIDNEKQLRKWRDESYRMERHARFNSEASAMLGKGTGVFRRGARKGDA